MDKLLHTIENLSLEDFKIFIIKFTKDYEEISNSPQLDVGQRERLWAVLFKQIDSENTDTVNCLKAIRILTREKSSLSAYISDDRLKTLLKLTCISSDSECNSESALEALKCLCNITFNLPNVSETLNSCGATIHIGNRLMSSKAKKDSLVRKLFEVQLLFLITLFSSSSRQCLYEECGVQFFTELCLEEGKIPKENLISPKHKKLSIGTESITLLSRILKTAYNIFCNIKTSGNNELKTFVAVLRELILMCLTPDTSALLSDIVNVLTVIPVQYMDALTIPGHKWSEKNIDRCPSMEAISIVIDFLDISLAKTEEDPGRPKEELSPVLIVLTKLAKRDRKYRKFIRSKVLPNLTEVYTRPEVGNTLRNKLCRLLTCPITSVRDFVADFLFILCKESVGRMVKYTGYGNAAGLFANRGLMGGQPSKSSSESEDSETEEYSQHKHMINPIVGCLTPPRTDETKNMTEEQKELLAMELVNKIDKLQRDGIIQPCRIGPDGKPQPVEHVLELQENGTFELNKPK